MTFTCRQAGIFPSKRRAFSFVLYEEPPLSCIPACTAEGSRPAFFLFCRKYHDRVSPSWYNSDRVAIILRSSWPPYRQGRFHHDSAAFYKPSFAAAAKIEGGNKTMTPYQMPSAGPQNSSPPPVPPVFNPAYLQEKRRLRQTSLFFGIATILYFAASVVISNLLNFLIQLSYQFFHRPPFGNSEVIYYLSSILAYILTFSIAYGAYMLLLRMPWKAAVPFRPVAAGKVLLCIPVTFSISIIGSIFTSILSILFTLIGYQPVSRDVSVPMTVP